MDLEGIFILESPSEGWEVKQEESIFYFLKKQAGELQPQAANGSANKMVLNLRKFRAVPEGGTRTIRAELTYGPLLKDKDNKPFQDEYGQYSSYGNTIFITNNRGGKKTLPLQVDFAAGNAVLNDGTATNSLELLIANKNWPSSNLSLSQDSEFVISFDMDNKEGAVATTAQVKAIGINSNSSNWTVQHVPNSTEWTVKPKSGISQLASNEAIKLNITNLVTSNSSGAGYLYVRYKNIPNYPDGQFVVPVEKSPLLYRLAQVGIGTTNPSAKLHVTGGDAIVSGKVGIGITFPSANAAPKIHLAIGDDDTGLQQQGDGELAIYTNNTERVRIDKNGNVGIGTITPKEKLHVVGGLVLGTDAVNKKFIIHSRSSGDSNQGDFLQITSDNSSGNWAWDRGTIFKRGGDVIIGGKVGIGMTTPSATVPKIHLAIGDDDTGLQQQGDGKLAIYTNNAERVRIDDTGKVGIGTITPKEKLHVVGDLVLGTDANNKKFIIHSRTNSIGDFLQITSDKSDGDWAWDRGIILKRDGNVGIGTNTPSAKLHVSGGDAIISGKVGIGITTPSANAVPKIHLAIGDDDTGLQNQGDGKLAIYTDSVERVRIEKNGNVGIGKTNPQQKLDVDGGICLTDVPVWDGPGAYDVTWNYQTGRISREGSSQRYKKNIATLEEDFQKILSLEPKQYQMNEGSGTPNTWEFGYIAEDLDKIGLKSLVIYNQSGQPDGIEYKKICIYLNEVVKSQQSSLERLEEKVHELNEKLISSR